MSRLPTGDWKVMKMGVRAVLCVGVLASALFALPQPAGAQATGWPDLPLTRVADGQTVSSAALARTQPWVVVVVRPHCRPCGAVVRRLATDAAGRASEQVVVILSALDAGEAAAVRAMAPGLPATAWYADPAGTAAVALGAQSAPALFGLRGASIEWTLRGSMFVDAQWQGVVVPWLR